jgi:MITF/TFEB/TFEC/TFE3 N-terminus
MFQQYIEPTELKLLWHFYIKNKENLSNVPVCHHNSALSHCLIIKSNIFQRSVLSLSFHSTCHFFISFIFIFYSRLQVRTQLANPTRYHVMQKQKNQVKQYLSESFKSTESLHNLIPYPVIQHSSMTSVALASKSQPATTCNSPTVKTSTNSKLLNHVNSKNGNHLSHSASEMIYTQSLDYSSGQSTSNNSFPFAFQQRYSPSEAASSAMSHSSVATSVTSASEVSIFNRKKVTMHISPFSKRHRSANESLNRF